MTIGKNYEFIGEDYTMTIKPNDIHIPNSTFIDFSSCESILRAHYSIPDASIITLLQFEVDNNDEQCLINNVGYQAYDEDRNPLDLSLCNDTNIQIFYLIKSDSSLDISFISSFKQKNIDILNIKDSFFNDICISYSEKKNDLILYDRVLDIYQNYSFCDEDCAYNGTNLDLKIITCDCEVKTNLTENMTSSDLVKKYEVEKSSIFAIAKCYKLFFSWENKFKNIGFWIFLVLIFLNIIMLIIYFYKGLKPIKEYLVKIMVEYGYVTESEGKKLIGGNIIEDKKKMKGEKSIEKNKNKINRIRRTKISTSLKTAPPKKINKKSIKISNENENKLFANDQNSTAKRINKENNKILVQINNIIKENNVINYNKDNKKKLKTTIKSKNTITKKSKKRSKKKSKTSISKINLVPTSGELKLNDNNKKDKKDDKEEDYINLNLINININKRTRTTYNITGSNHVLNVYTNFQEAIKNDMRSICRIYYIYLLTKQAIFHAFLYRSPLELFPLRFCLLIFIFSSDLALNALFYFDDKISEKYRYAKSLFLFAFSNNITVILLSTFIGFVLLTLFTKLSNATNNIRDIFISEEEKLKNDKKYKVTDKRKKEIQKEIGVLLKKYKIKTIILIAIELTLILFFWYYVTIFCHVYASTQISWIWDSFLSILSRITIDLLLTLLFAKFYRVAVESNIHCLYKIALFFYSFG